MSNGFTRSDHLTDTLKVFPAAVLSGETVVKYWLHVLFLKQLVIDTVDKRLV